MGIGNSTKYSNVTGTENTIFSILSERFLTAEYIDDSNHPRCGQLALTVPLRATLEGATVYVHPDGKIEFDLNKYLVSTFKYQRQSSP